MTTVPHRQINSNLPNIKASRLHPLFGQRITGIDLREPYPTRLVEHLRSAFEQHSVLVFPAQHLRDHEQVRFAELFGHVDPVKVGSIGAGTKTSLNSNVDEEGNLVAANHKQALTIAANQLWHSDSSYKPVPAKASLMSAQVVPPEGGETEFISMRAVLEAMPESLRAAINGLSAIHSYATSRDQIDPALMSAEERACLPPVVHPIVRTNPVNGRSALFVGSHVSRIRELDPQASERLINRLMNFATRPEFVYCHKWRSGDLIFWDNRAVIHRGRPWNMDTHPRVMMHTCVGGAAFTKATS